jgi:HEXXH motif-containing protein
LESPERVRVRHVVPLKHFDTLATGGGGPETIRLLMSGERSRRLLLLRLVLDAAATSEDARGPMPDVAEVWNLLITAQDRAPKQFDDILMQPQIGMWLAHCLRRLQGMVPGRIPLWVDIGYAFNIALAVAARAGIELRTMVSYRDGTVMLPTLGLARLPIGPACGVAEASVEAGHISLRARPGAVVHVPPPWESDTSSWWHMRRIRSRSGGLDLSIWLDDIDPYRQIGEPVPPDRLPDAEARRWQRLLDDACAILARDIPSLAAAMAAGLISVVPLAGPPSIPVRSASSGDSFGSALISTPPDPAMLAVTLIHEFQHIKLGGLLHLLPLCREDSRPRFHAPWRDDPRPLSGLLQGVYAFTSVTEFWRAHRRSGNCVPSRDLAEFEFALWREQTWRALQALRADPGLTNAGRRFAEGLAAQTRTWWGEHVDPRIAAAAKTAAEDHRIGWRIRHMRPDSGHVADLMSRLDRGLDARLDSTPGSRVVPDLGTPWSHQRVALTRLRFSDPAEFGRLLSSERGDRGLLAGDLALISGDDRAAADAYADLLSTDPRQADAWTGLVLALSGPDHAIPQPELLPELYREQCANPRAPGAGPHTIINWLRDAGH